MVAVLAVLSAFVLGVGAPATRAEHARGPPLLFLLLVDELLVEHPGAESADAYADARAPSQSAESSEPERQVHRELLGRELLGRYEHERKQRQSAAATDLGAPGRRSAAQFPEATPTPRAKFPAYVQAGLPHPESPGGLQGSAGAADGHAKPAKPGRSASRYGRLESGRSPGA